MFSIRLYKISLLGFRVFIHYLKNNMIFFDLGLYNNKSLYSKASGTFSQLLQVNSDLNLVLILLPSGKKKYVSLNYLCTLGRNNNIFTKFLIIGKAGLNRNFGKNVTVRGVAMNPIDHPHGGRTKTNKPEVSP
jgi:large subunit ribosomal protein L2